MSCAAEVEVLRRTAQGLDVEDVIAETVEGAPVGALPPHDLTEIAAALDPVVVPLGYRVTRGALVDRNVYQRDPAGTHLAIYLAPIEDVSADRYAEDFPVLTAALMPLVFDKWGGLESFDFCQEERDSALDTAPSWTLFDITRTASVGISWPDITLAELIALNDLEDVLVVGAPPVSETQTWLDAAGE